MPLSTGTKLGPYEILAPLGAGGMGEVYRATDTRLKRDVAIKVLLESFADDPDRLARFQREGEVLASLNHPNIAAVYGLEKADGLTGIVLELVDGDTLADVIARGSIAISDALPIARQIADALECAHEQGIVHRDLKPANIKLRPDGAVKVLDFGLAKLIEAGATSGVGGVGEVKRAAVLSQSPTITTPAMTMAGVILGTAAYMSPEQAKGRPADKRSDVWAFGCVLYEMLSGRRAFDGEDVSDTLAAVLRGEPEWDALPAALPPSIRALLKGCLERDRRQRIGDIAAARFVLSEQILGLHTPSGAVLPQPRQRPTWHWAIPLVVTAVAIGASGLLVGRNLQPVARQPQVTRFPLTLPNDQRLTEFGGQIIAISPDGSHVAYIANRRVYVRALSETDARSIPGTESNEDRLTNITFSPDGQSIAFLLGNLGAGPFRRVPLGGGTPVTIGRLTTYAFDPTWRDDGVVFGQRQQGIVRLATNGRQELLIKVTDGMVARPQVLPDGDSVLFAMAPGVSDPTGAAADTWDTAKIVVKSMKSGQEKVLVDGGGAPTYVPTGHLLYAVGGTVFAAPFDYRRRELTGGAVPVIEGVARPVFASAASPTVYYRVSDNGTLIYVPGPAATSAGQFLIAYVDAKNHIERLNLRPATYLFPRLSPDGTQLALGTEDAKDTNIWIYDLSGASALRQLTLRGKNRYPVWSGDGQQVAFQSDREGDLAIYAQRADGSAPAERLTKPASGIAHIPESWSPDGQTLLDGQSTPGTIELWALSLREKKTYRFGDVQSSIDPTSAVFSPDGRWVAYLATENDNRTVFVEAFPSNGVKHPIGTGIWHPVWSADGRQLFYRASAGREFVVRVTTQPTFSIGNPEVMMATAFQSRGRVEREYDITRDGRFIGIVAAGEGQALGETAGGTRQQINVVLNWFEELKQRVPVK